MENQLYTIGHSNFSIEEFVRTLQKVGINAIADVRSIPYSRFTPQFNREFLYHELKRHGVSYVYLGKELGAISTFTNTPTVEATPYEIRSRSDNFKQGIERLIKGTKSYRISLMCAEKDPIDCHRAILVTRNISKFGVGILHIHSDGSIENNNDFESRLCRFFNRPIQDMFLSERDIIENCYDARHDEISWQENQANPISSTG